jgi:hypothetical protein
MTKGRIREGPPLFECESAKVRKCESNELLQLLSHFRTSHSRTSPYFGFIVDLVARHASAETVASSPRATPVSRTAAIAGRAKLLYGRRERQADGSAAEGHENFFSGPQLSSGAPRSLPSRLHLLRDRVNLPLARSRRERAGSLALRDFSRSRIRCSWRLGPCAFGSDRRRLMTRRSMSMRGPSKKFSWPLTASAPSVQPDVPRRMSNPKRGSAPPASGMPPNAS